jgi:hypothetical protein
MCMQVSKFTLSMHLNERRPADSQNIGQHGAGLATLFPCLRVPRKEGSLLFGRPHFGKEKSPEP